MMRIKSQVLDKNLILQSNKLTEIIKTELEKKKRLFFDEYMQIILYTPEYGYYASAKNIIGKGGDFTTAPELTPIFAECFSNSFIDVLKAIDDASMLELGAGTGRFASEVLKSLEAKNHLPVNYYILEVNAYLKNQQQQLLKQEVPHLFDRIIWLDQLPDDQAFNGVIFANEVMDAMPVARFIKKNNQVNELCVQLENEKLILVETEPRENIFNLVSNIEAQVGELGEGYISEINLWIKNWIRSLAKTLNKGAIFLVDYGYDRKDFYRADRFNGTLQCYINHTVHDDALCYPGIQDVTAHVDFTEVASAGVENGLVLEGYTTQQAFLASCQIDEIYQRQFEQLPAKLRLKLTSQVKTLMMPEAMGEVFKVIAFSQNVSNQIKGFDFQDLSFRL